MTEYIFPFLKNIPFLVRILNWFQNFFRKPFNVIQDRKNGNRNTIDITQTEKGMSVTFVSTCIITIYSQHTFDIADAYIVKPKLEGKLNPLIIHLKKNHVMISITYNINKFSFSKKIQKIYFIYLEKIKSKNNIVMIVKDNQGNKIKCKLQLHFS